MKKFLILSTLLLTQLIVIPAKADMTQSTGKELLQYCKLAIDIHDKQFGNPQTESEYILGSKTGICEGYLMSANETRFQSITTRGRIQHDTHPVFCLPPTYNLLVGAAVVVNYLKEHPDQESLPASFLVRRSLETYFPCMRA